MPNDDARLKLFGLTPDALVGSGGESRVYALDQERVLKLYQGHPITYLERRQQFYAWLKAQHTGFETPNILEIGNTAAGAYTLETRMGGRDFAKVLPTLTGPARERALQSYLSVADALGHIPAPSGRWGELMHPEPLEHERWTGYLHARLEATLKLSRDWLEADLPDFRLIYQHFSQSLEEVVEVEHPGLVHGDYFPGNVFIDADGLICGVGDFGYTTCVGDPLMDIAGAIVFLSVMPGHQPEDEHFLRSLVGKALQPAIDVYGIYYAIYFSGCKIIDPPTYEWCLDRLRVAIRQ